MSKAEIDAIINKIAKLEKQGLLNNSPSLGQTEFMREVEILSDENFFENFKGRRFTT